MAAADSHEGLLSGSALPASAAKWPTWRKLTVIFLGVVSSLLCAGLVFGFAGLYVRLLQRGVFFKDCLAASTTSAASPRLASTSAALKLYSGGSATRTAEHLLELAEGGTTIRGGPQLGTPEDGIEKSPARGRGASTFYQTCPQQELDLSLMFTLATTLLNVTAFFAGVALDTLGPRLAAALAASTSACGSLLFGLEQYYAGFQLMAVAGPLVYMSTISFANLYPQRGGLITSACVGSFDASSFVFVLLSFLIGLGFSFDGVFRGYSVVGFGLAALFLVFYPEVPVQPGGGAGAAAVDGAEEGVAGAADDGAVMLKNNKVDVGAGVGGPDLINTNDDPERSVGPPSSATTRTTRIRDERAAVMGTDSDVANKPTGDPPGPLSRVTTTSSRPPPSSSMIELQPGSPRDGVKVKPAISKGTTTSETAAADREHAEFLAMLEAQENFAKYDGLPLSQQIFSVDFALFAFAASCYMVRLNFFIESVPLQMQQFSDSWQEADQRTHVFSVMLPAAGIVGVPFIGFLTDRCGLLFSWGALWLLFLVFQLFQEMDCVYAAFTAICFSRPLVYTMIAVFSSRRFGLASFGKVYGAIMSIAGVVNSSQYALHLAVLHISYAEPATLSLSCSSPPTPSKTQVAKKISSRRPPKRIIDPWSYFCDEFSFCKPTCYEIIAGIWGIPVIGFLADQRGIIDCWFALWFFFLCSDFLFALACSQDALGVGLAGDFVLYAAFAFFSVSRPLFYTSVAVFTGRRFGFRKFGKVYGTVCSIAGAANALQYFLKKLVSGPFDGDFVPVNRALTVVQCLTVSLPLYLLWDQRRDAEQRRREENLGVSQAKYTTLASGPGQRPSFTALVPQSPTAGKDALLTSSARLQNSMRLSVSTPTIAFFNSPAENGFGNAALDDVNSISMTRVSTASIRLA